MVFVHSLGRLIPYPFLGFLVLGLGFRNHKVGYPKKGVWYEPTGTALAMVVLLYFKVQGLFVIRRRSARILKL